MSLYENSMAISDLLNRNEIFFFQHQMKDKFDGHINIQCSYTIEVLHSFKIFGPVYKGLHFPDDIFWYNLFRRNAAYSESIFTGRTS